MKLFENNASTFVVKRTLLIFAFLFIMVSGIQDSRADMWSDLKKSSKELSQKVKKKIQQTRGGETASQPASQSSGNSGGSQVCAGEARISELEKQLEQERERAEAAERRLAAIETQGTDNPVLSNSGQSSAGHKVAVANPKLSTKTPKLAAQGGGSGSTGFFFSNAPIDTGGATKYVDHFTVDQPVYALIRTEKSWSDLYKGKPDPKVMIMMFVDGKKVWNQYVHIKSVDYARSTELILDIIPDPQQMLAYKDPGLEYLGSGEKKMGPVIFSKKLSGLSAGSHKVQFQVFDFGRIYAQGEFTLQGADYSGYAGLHETYLAELEKKATFPVAKKTDIALENKMRDLLSNAGWSEIVRLNIVDKDWWNDLAEGGNSAVVSRHIAAAALAKNDAGEYYYRICTFNQPKLLIGGFGPLELTHQGPDRPVPKENIDK